MKKIISILCVLTLIFSVSGQKLDRSIVPSPGPAPEINLGKIESFTLENGLKVFVVENHKLPKVSYSLQLNIDPIMEGDMAGYITIAGDLIGRGTSTRTKQEIDAEIDFIGASLSTFSSGAFGTSLKKHQEKLLTLMSDVVMNADFKQEELEKIKKQMISGLASEKDSPDAIASKVASILLYGKDHPYGEYSSEESIENVTLSKCKEYYTTYFRPNVSYMAVVGDITLEEAKKNVEKYFGEWKKGKVPSYEYKTPKSPSKTQVAFVHKEGLTQSSINITYPIDLKKNNPDVIKATIMNSILGGSGTARLFMNLREGHGYTYGAYSRINSDQLVGSFNASAKVRNEVTDSSLVQFNVELNRIIKEKVSEEDLQDVKSYMTGTFAYSLQNPQTIARFAINTDKYELPSDYYATYLKQISAVTIDDIQEMAKKYIRPNNALILIVGDKEIGKTTAPFSANESVDYYDIDGNVYVEPMMDAPEGVTAESVIENSIKAVYGMTPGKELTKMLGKQKDITINMTASIQGQSLDVVRKQKAPNKFLTEMTMSGMVVQKKVFNGTTGKNSGMRGASDIEGEELEELKTSSIMFADTKYKELGFKFELLGMEEVEGSNAYKLTVTSPNGKDETHWYNVKSGFQVKSMTIETDDESGESMTIVTTLEDYKSYEGISYPYIVTQSFGPQSLKMEIKSIEVNSKMKDDVFE